MTATVPQPDLDAYEQDIEDNLDLAVAAPDLEDRKRSHRQAARNTLRRSKKAFVRVTEQDFEALKRKAANEGLPYQTLIASVLHKFVSGRLKEA